MYGVPMTITQRGKTLSGLLSDGSPFSIDLNAANPFPVIADFVHSNATLTATLALPGDFNNDGGVDAADYAVWRNNLGSSSTLPNDTSPGMVTEHDYETWRASFGNSSSGAAGFAETSVPEPSSFLLLIGMAACSAICRWPRRKV
jgi:hypothetical protein